ncbi:MAG: phytoene desaturase [Chloroflexi bacterium]|nr:MAG: phytoene desaturase [Chloroflexota bacterium]
MRQSERVVVVGGGLGGLAAAIRCAVAGRPTTLIEARPNVGGKLNIVRDQGFVWDIGPSLLTMPWVLDDLLRVAGSSLAAELDVVALPSACRYMWADGTRFDAMASLPALIQSIAAINPRDVGNFMRFMQYSQQLWDLSADQFLDTPMTGWQSLLDWRVLRDGWRLDGLRTMDVAVRSFFESPQLQQVMNRFATYNGSSPYRTPATFNLIAWAEFGFGAFYPRGGLYRIAEVLHATALRVGVDIRTATAVTGIQHQQGRVSGVTTSDGETIATQRVISNVDPQVTLAKLLDGGARRAQRLAQRELSTSGFVVLWGLRQRYDQLDHHTICFSPDYRAEFADTDAGRLHDTPTIYLNHTVGYDLDHAPVGGQNIFALVNVPATRGSQIDWPNVAAQYADQLVSQLETRFGLAGFRQNIVVQHILTPHDLAQRYNAPGGSIYGLASNSTLSAFMRPPQRDPQIAGLYYCGGGTHPGGGIPLALLSGKHAAQLVS